MDQVETAIVGVTAALEASQAAIRSVATQLEAEFDRIYCGVRGPASTAVNPARLAARMTALDAAVPAAADAVLELAHTNLEAVRAARAAAVDAKEHVMHLVQDLPRLRPADGGSTDAQTRPLSRILKANGDVEKDDVGDDGGEVERLERLCETLKTFVSDSQRAHNALVASQTSTNSLLSIDDLDMELLKSGLASSSASTSPSDQNGNNAIDGTSTNKNSVRSVSRRTPSKIARTSNGPGTSKTHCPRQTSNRTPQWKSETTQQGSDAADGSPAAFTPISKGAYQRLPRSLKQQAKLDDLNDLYAKVHTILSSRRNPMTDAELLDATGESSLHRLDVLRRGFSVLRHSNNCWSLGSVPAKTAARLKSTRPFGGEHETGPM
jgi:hypothetical protein